jgi:hypothetical protein
MICLVCREAGDFIAAARPLIELSTVTPAAARQIRDQADTLHRQCINVTKSDPRGTWCDCQHKLEGVNWQMLNFLREKKWETEKRTEAAATR